MLARLCLVALGLAKLLLVAVRLFLIVSRQFKSEVSTGLMGGYIFWNARIFYGLHEHLCVRRYFVVA